ncbi:MAG TPA: TetR/AcrR family transcriptional regulator [Firmicutes bacterium]|jgi:TetR/AcrR family fatty acid metabolism transcriptional regulator|nr:TetR/AcrR family transcriptional regulator [Bacillota bacterium]
MSEDKKAFGDKRLRIIEAATAVFSRKGFHKARVGEIAEEAEVGKGTVYEYFSSKKELFLEMIFYAHQQYGDYLEKELCQIKNFPDGLKKLFDVTIQFMEQHREMALVLMADHPMIDDDIHTALLRKERERFAFMSGMLKDLARRGEIRPINIKAALLVIFGTLYLVNGKIVFSNPDQEKGPDFKQLSRDAIDILLHGLAK